MAVVSYAPNRNIHMALQLSSRSRKWRNTPPTVEITATTYRSLRKIADVRGQSMSGAIFQLAHDQLSELYEARHKRFLPFPFDIEFGQRDTIRTVIITHPDLERLELTLAECRNLLQQLDMRSEPPVVRYLETALGGVRVNVRRGRQGVRITTNEKRLNLSRIEADTLADAIDDELSRVEKMA